MIDLRSDTVTRPSKKMLNSMQHAPVGDDVYDDDPTMHKLQDKVADLLGKEAALFMASGTQSNLAALLCHLGRGEEFIVGNNYHIFSDEAGGAAALGGLSPYPITTQKNHMLGPKDIENAIKPDDIHCPITKLICLENTVHGLPIPLDNFKNIYHIAKKNDLKIHLDGARLANAAVALDVNIAEIASYADSVSLCLSKGLGAPIGSVLAGKASFIKKARRQRKLLGGGMRQVGVLAACGLIAIEDNMQRIVEDHHNAYYLDTMLFAAQEDHLPIKVHREQTKTNMVFVTFEDSENLPSYLAEKNIFISGTYGHSGLSRLVTHCDIDKRKIDIFIDAIKDFYHNKRVTA